MVGTGGQGILLLARALAEIAVRQGYPVIASETHGMAMRGGTVTANLKIGSFASPLIPAGSADILIGLDAAESLSLLHMLKTGGIAAVNAPAKDAFDFTVDATGLALAEGMPGSVNMIMLGFVLKLLGIRLDEAHQVMQDISPKRSLADNIKAIAIGYTQMQQHDAQGGQ